MTWSMAAFHIVWYLFLIYVGYMKGVDSCVSQCSECRARRAFEDGR